MTTPYASAPKTEPLDGVAMVWCDGAFATPEGKAAHGLVRFTRRYPHPLPGPTELARLLHGRLDLLPSTRLEAEQPFRRHAEGVDEQIPGHHAVVTGVGNVGHEGVVLQADHDGHIVAARLRAVGRVEGGGPEGHGEQRNHDGWLPEGGIAATSPCPRKSRR